MKIKSFLFILSMLSLCSCASQQPKTDTLDQLVALADKVDTYPKRVTQNDTRIKGNDRSNIQQLIATLDSLNEYGIKISEDENLIYINNIIEKATLLDTLYSQKGHTESSKQLAISLKELQFYIFVNVQEQMTRIYNNEDLSNKSSDTKKPDVTEVEEREEDEPDYDNYEMHRGTVFKQKISWTLPYIQSTQRYSRKKTKLLSEIFQLTTQSNTPANRKRGWLAIDRILDDIDLQKSESGYDPFQRSAHGIYTRPGEIINKLEAIYAKETDPATKLNAQKIIKKNKKRLSSKRTGKFWAEVEESKKMNKLFKKSLHNEKHNAFIEVDDDSESAPYWFNLGYANNDDQKKIEYFTKAIELNPEFTAAYNNRGNCFQNSGDYEQALRDYNKSITLDPDYAPVYINRGNVYQQLNNTEQAIQDYSKAIELEPEYTLAYNYRGLSYKAMGNYPAAIRDFTKAIKSEPRLISAYINRGDVYRHTGDYENAVKDYKEVIQLDPTNAVVHNNLGIVYKDMNKYYTAIKYHNEAIELQPDFTTAYYNLGIAYWELRKWSQVIKAWEKCLELEPDHPQVNKWLPKAREESKPKFKTIKKKIKIPEN